MESQEGRAGCGFWGWQVHAMVGGAEEERHVQRGRGCRWCVGESPIFRAVATELSIHV